MQGDRNARAAVVRLIRAHPGISRIALSDRLGLSRSTVTRIVSTLLLDGLAVEGDSITTETAGRRPTALSLDARNFELVGAEVSGTMVTCALANLDGKTVHEASAQLPKNGGQGAVQALLEVIRGVQDAADSHTTVRGVGIGAPGVIDAAAGRVVWAPSLSWRDLPLRQIAEEYLGVPTFVENDVRLSTIGEQWIGSAVGAQEMAYVYVGEGVGSGIMVHGELLRGHHNAAGEVGYLLPNRELVGLDHRDTGAMESMATTSGLARRLRALCAEPGRSSDLLANIDPFEQLPITPILALAAKNADAVAAQLASELLDHVAMIITGIVAVADPEVVVLGGDIGTSNAWVLEALRDRLALTLPSPPTLRASKLGARAGVVGASVHALLEVEDLYVRRLGVPVA